jgi:predicted Rossmann-fold nucleotide-binding protein
LDELFETLTLMQTQKVKNKTPIVLFGKEFWDGLIDFDTLVQWGMISEEDLSYIHITDSVEDAFNFVVSQVEKLK